MKRIEQLLNIGRNSERFNMIVKDMHQNKLVVFFGAGMSLWENFRSWEYPFKWIQNKLDSYYAELKEHYKNFDINTSTEESLNLINQKLNLGKQCSDFLEWGDILQQIIGELKKVSDKKKYNITFHLQKEDGDWVLEDISDSDREKIHGLYQEVE